MRIYLGVRNNFLHATHPFLFAQPGAMRHFVEFYEYQYGSTAKRFVGWAYRLEIRSHIT